MKRLRGQAVRSHQVSARGGTLGCTNLDDRVEVSGRAVTYLVGEIFI